jgi:ATP-binding cassette subfamily A (ABC1) protein 2
MKVMGLGNAVHWVAWFIQSFTTLAVCTTALALLLRYGGLLPNTDPSLVSVMFMLYAASSIAQVCARTPLA